MKIPISKVKVKAKSGKVYNYEYANIRELDGPTPDELDKDTTNVGKNTVEDQMISLMDELQLFKDLEPDLRKALKTKDVKQMLKGTTVWALAQMIKLAKDTNSDAVRQGALKDLLDRAGLKPVDKTLNINAGEMTESELDAKLASMLKESYGEPKGTDKEASKGTEGRAIGNPGPKGQGETKE